MASIDVTFTEAIDFRACYGTCSPGKLFVEFTAVPKQILSDAWPKDGDGNPIPINYTLEGFNAVTLDPIATQTGFLLPDLTYITPPSLNDGIYNMTITLYDWVDPSVIGYSLAKLVIVDEDAQCCQVRLSVKAADKKCGNELKDDLFRVILLRDELAKLLTCNNDVAGGQLMFDTIAAICRKYNCNCN